MIARLFCRVVMAARLFGSIALSTCAASTVASTATLRQGGVDMGWVDRAVVPVPDPNSFQVHYLLSPGGWKLTVSWADRQQGVGAERPGTLLLVAASLSLLNCNEWG